MSMRLDLRLPNDRLDGSKWTLFWWRKKDIEHSDKGKSDYGTLWYSSVTVGELYYETILKLGAN